MSVLRRDPHSFLHSLPPALIHILHSASIFFFFLLFSLITKSFILPSAAPSVWLSLSWSQRPPTHSSLCCKYRGLDGTLLYLARQMCNYAGPFGPKSHSGGWDSRLFASSLSVSLCLVVSFLPPFFLSSSPCLNLSLPRLKLPPSSGSCLNGLRAAPHTYLALASLTQPAAPAEKPSGRTIILLKSKNTYSLGFHYAYLQGV